jgi:hypothetical protein
MKDGIWPALHFAGAMALGAAYDKLAGIARESGRRLGAATDIIIRGDTDLEREYKTIWIDLASDDAAATRPR